MTLRLRLLLSSGYKKKEFRYACLLGTEIVQSVRYLGYGLDDREIGVLFPAGS
jgi:hypothetical protein